MSSNIGFISHLRFIHLKKWGFLVLDANIKNVSEK